MSPPSATNAPFLNTAIESRKDCTWRAAARESQGNSAQVAAQPIPLYAAIEEWSTNTSATLTHFCATGSTTSGISPLGLTGHAVPLGESVAVARSMAMPDCFTRVPACTFCPHVEPGQRAPAQTKTGSVRTGTLISTLTSTCSQPSVCRTRRRERSLPLDSGR
jgi:hypothetical protein